MKKTSFLSSLLLLVLSFSAYADSATAKHFKGTGEVVAVDAVYSRITIKHAPIQGFSGGPETEFFVSSGSLLKKINVRDLVEFDLNEDKGDAQIVAIQKTGEVPFKEAEGLPVGQAVQDVLVGTGEVVKTVASPIAPAGEVVSGAVGATTDTTGSVLKDAKPEVKKSF